MNDKPEILTYRIGSKHFTTIAEAQASVSSQVVSWEPKFYDACEYHGDSMVGFDANGKRVCELKFLSNHRFCNAHLHDKECAYEH